jgi:uncharacterized protein involved in exopolysaccharide biosynthesis
VQVLALVATQQQDGPLLWIAVGAVLGLLLGFAYAAVRRAFGRGRGRGR